MNLELFTAVAFGVVLGLGMGWMTAWRLARKLEFHGVRLCAWDRPFDPQAQSARDNVTSINRGSQL